MGSMLTTNSPGLLEQRNQRAERGRNHKSCRRKSGGTSSDKTHTAINTHHVEVHVCQITRNKNEAYGMVPPNVMEPQKTSPEGVETQSLLGTSRSSKVASGILGTETAVKVADPTGDTMVRRTEVQATGLDLQCEDEVPSEACKMHVVGQDFGSSHENSKETCVPESPLHSSVVSEEDIPLKVFHALSPVVQEVTSWKAMEDLHSPLNAPGEDELTADDQKVSGKMDLKLGPEMAEGNAEHDIIVQRQVHDASSGEALGMAETHPSLPSADTSDSPV